MNKDQRRFQYYWGKASDLSRQEDKQEEMRKCVEHLKELYPICMSNKPFKDKAYFLCCLSSFMNYCGMYTDSIVYGLEAVRLYKKSDDLSNIAHLAKTVEQLADARKELGFHEASLKNYEVAIGLRDICPHSSQRFKDKAKDKCLEKSCEILEKMCL